MATKMAAQPRGLKEKASRELQKNKGETHGQGTAQGTPFR
jgi:hypothetical protein